MMPSLGAFSAKDILVKLVLSGLALVFIRATWNYVRSPLKSFPGPAASKFTNLWRLFGVYKGRVDITCVELHRKHGSAVRMGPNVLSLSDPSLVKVIFRTKDPFKKSTMYYVNDAIVDGQRVSNLFATTDEAFHSYVVQPIKSCYSMTKIQDFEPNIDETINLFLEKLDERFADKGVPCEMADYMLYFAWDAMSKVSFVKFLGLLEAGNDDQRYLCTLRSMVNYFAHISQIPKADEWLVKNPIYSIGPEAVTWTTRFSMEAYKKRLEGGPKDSSDGGDFLDKFIEAKNNRPDVIDDNMVIMYLLANVAAGSDTTGIALIAALYHVLKNPSVHRKLCEEIDNARLTIPVSWKSSQELPYLDAVLKEAWRIHPSIGLMLERIVPEGGLTLSDGRFVPQDTIVGMNPWVINRDENVFGPEPDRFIPERWLKLDDESEEDFKARRAKMKASDLTFGAGKRGCIGKYLSFLESYKVLATLFMKYDIALKSPDVEWELHNQWFVYPKNVPVVLRKKSS